MAEQTMVERVADDMSDDDYFKKGAKGWCRGDSMPDWPRRSAGPAFYYWLGYMHARARDFFRRRRMALYPDMIKFRP